MFPKNALLEEIAARLSSMPFPLEDAVEEWVYNFRHTSWADVGHVDNSSSADNSSLAGFAHVIGSIAELGISQNLSKIAEEWGSRVMIDPIKEKSVRKGKYELFYNMFGQLIAADKLKHCKIGEYDGLFLADELPVVVEVKLRRGRDIRRSSKFRLNRALSLGHLQKKLHPLEEYFSQPVGHIFVTYQNRITATSEVQQKYLDAGGILVPFPLDCLDYHQKVAGAFLGRLVKGYHKTSEQLF